MSTLAEMETLSSLLLKLYAAPAEPALWTTAFSQLTQQLGLSGMAVLFEDVNDRYSAQLYCGPQQEEVWRLYEAHFGPLDVYRTPFMGRSEGELVWGDDLCSREEMRKSEFYNDLLQPYDIRMTCGTWSLKRPSSNEVILFHTGVNSRDLDPDSVAILNLLLPHLRMALRIRQQLATVTEKEAQLAGTLDLSEHGIVLLDKRGRCLFVNKSARSVFTPNSLHLQNGELRAGKPSETFRLQAIVKQACETGTGKSIHRGGAIAISRPEGRALQVLVGPFVADSLSHSFSSSAKTAAVALISDPDRKPISRSKAVQTLYGLTPAEAKLVDLLSSGLTVADAANANCVTRETIRSQIKSIFAKTGTTRQVDLLRLVYSIPMLNLGVGVSTTTTGG